MFSKVILISIIIGARSVNALAVPKAARQTVTGGFPRLPLFLSFRDLKFPPSQTLDLDLTWLQLQSRRSRREFSLIRLN